MPGMEHRRWKPCTRFVQQVCLDGQLAEAVIAKRCARRTLFCGNDTAVPNNAVPMDPDSATVQKVAHTPAKRLHQL
jgi:hypothetical protein